MALRVLRVGVAVLLGASGSLMYAASWQRWAGACPWGEGETDRCLLRQDHRYDVLWPSVPWEPVGDAAQLAGWSLLVLAVAFLALPWAVTGRRPNLVSATALGGVVLALVAVGVATLRSGLTGSLVRPVAPDVTLQVWFLVSPALLVWFAITASGGWSRAAAAWLVLASPFAALLSYAQGPYDAQPWWEAISGVLTVAAGLSLLGAAVLGSRTTTDQDAGTVAPTPVAR